MASEVLHCNRNDHRVRGAAMVGALYLLVSAFDPLRTFGTLAHDRMMDNWLIILASLAAQSQGVTTVDASMFELSDGRTEYCRNFDGHDIDLSMVALLKNPKFDLRPYGVNAIIEIDRDVVTLTATPGSSFRSFSQDMRYNALKGESVDVDLAIALSGRHPLLYWKETFKHKEARLGLMEIPSDGAPLRSFCIGGPTVTASH